MLRRKPTIKPFLVMTAARQIATLAWLPVTAVQKKKGDRSTRSEGKSRRCRTEANSLGYRNTRVEWSATGVQAVGCQLIYRLPGRAEQAIREAVDEVVEVMGWQRAEHQ